MQKVGADQVVFAIRFSESAPSGFWRVRKYEIADFVSNCWYGFSAANSFEITKRIHVDNIKPVRAVTYAEYSWNDNERFFELAELEFYGSISQCIMEMTDGLQEHYPDIDYEFHYYECYGRVSDDIYIYLGGKWYSKKQDFKRLKVAQYIPSEIVNAQEKSAGIETMNAFNLYTKSIKPIRNRPKTINYPSGLRWKVPKFK